MLINLILGGIDSRYISWFLMLGVAAIYLPNEKIVSLDQQRTQYFHSNFLPLSRGFGLRIGIFFVVETRFTLSSFWGGVMLQDDL